MRSMTAILILTLAASAAPAAAADSLDSLAKDFWTWRAAEQPASGDDITRLDRPDGWAPEVSKAALEARIEELRAFEERFRALPDAGTIAQRVDRRLIGSALARGRWELVVNPGWRRNPLFYVEQTLGSLFEDLILPPPFDERRVENLLARFDRIPATAAAARANLDQARAPFARLAVAALADADGRLATVAKELVPLVPAGKAARLTASAATAGKALVDLRRWLEGEIPKMPSDTAVGREAYGFFLREVALLPYSPERLVEMGRQEWERVVAFEVVERNRRRDLPALSLPKSRAEQIETMDREAAWVREFLEREGIQSVPAWVKSYRLKPKPGYLAPLADLGVNNDFTGPRRLDRDGTAWIDEPSPAAGYFYRAYAAEPRTQIAHESHGHYLQLVLSWAHPDWIRRHYYDSGANEGIAFYNEELMAQAGLFADRPKVREVIYNFARLRALRVEVDVKLATGQMSIAEAAQALTERVPMDPKTALDEAAFFASAPGQAISYQIGKIQILRLLADARLAQGDTFSLRAFHDFLWRNGNVPLALQRWELLGDDSDLVPRP
jgi:uncharacterized protein (DUF885 family)